MEKRDLYPVMPAQNGMPDPPPTYNQSYPTAPPAVMSEMMPSSGAGSMQMQPQQQQFLGLPPIPPLGPRPCLVTCPSCHQEQMSNIRLESATKTHLFATLLCVVGLCCCACIPYCVDSCKNANHYCSHCDAYLGMYNK